MRIALVVFLVAAVSNTYSWNIPNLPSGRRSQYYVLHNDGGYKYGYDTGTDYFAKQSGDSQNEVAGHYMYRDINGRPVDIRYTAGVRGFVPEGLEGLHPQPSGPYAAVHPYTHPAPTAYSSQSSSTDDEANTGDSSYNFSIDTDTYQRQESSDAYGNVQGRYSYTNEAGQHDLSYIAGAQTGFVATSGSLAQAGGPLGQIATTRYASGRNLPLGSSENSVNTDGSYSFGFSTGDQSRQESSDASGNVQGRYSYTNEAGAHDLSYVAGAATGFQPTGGNLLTPSSLPHSSPQTPVSVYSAPSSADNTNTVINPDGSYSFSYSTNDQSRQENSDANGNVQGSYSFRNEAGNHDLSYVAGSATGFQPTGGSLATPSTAGNTAAVSTYSAPASTYPLSSYSAPHPSIPASNVESSSNPDGSYSFSFSTADQSRQESSDASGNVQGRYSYTNAAGSHDLSYVAGSQTGFLPTGGNLAVPNGLEGNSGSSVPTSYSAPSLSTTYSGASQENEDDQANTGDASYSFTVDTPDYQRQETSDAQGNVRGSFSYRNMAGQHDLSFVAGSQTGFQPTGGNLAQPNGLAGQDVSSPTSYSAPANAAVPVTSYSGSSQENEDDQANTGDASYNFTVDTPEYQRHESSDAQGNVRGSYSYSNRAGSHDLSYVAGSGTGFVATGGSLAVPNGLGDQSATSLATPIATPVAVPAASVRFLPPQARSNVIHSANSVVRTYLPAESHSKYGYVYES